MHTRLWSHRRRLEAMERNRQATLAADGAAAEKTEAAA
jgi:hypothetical protein